MAQTTGISDSEWEVIKVIWDRGPMTAGQVVEALGGTDWRPRTIKTLLARLVKKGAVKVDRDDNRHLYRAAVTRENATRREARSFLTRVFDGALAPALVAFLDDAELSPTEIRQLKQILDREVKR
jgi:BlaI family penicillinase repressor